MAFISFDVKIKGLDQTTDKVRAASKVTENELAVQIKTDTAKFVPALTLSLDRRTRVEGNKIIYPGPNSQYLYYGKLMVDPDTGSSWAKKGAVKVLTDKDLIFNKSVHSLAQSHWFESSKALNKDNWIKLSKESFLHALKK